MSGCTPLQCALLERKHDMVDVLLSFPDLPITDLKSVKSILILGNPANTLERNVIERLLEKGQRLFVCPSSADQDLRTFIKVTTDKTKNNKLTIHTLHDDVKGWDSMDFILVFDNISKYNLLIQKASRQSKPHYVWVTPLRHMDSHQTVEKLGMNNHDYSLVETPGRVPFFDTILHFIGMATWTETLVQRIVNRVGCEANDDTTWF